MYTHVLFPRLPDEQEVKTVTQTGWNIALIYVHTGLKWNIILLLSEMSVRKIKSNPVIAGSSWFPNASLTRQHTLFECSLFSHFVM